MCVPMRAHLVPALSRIVVPFLSRAWPVGSLAGHAAGLGRRVGRRGPAAHDRTCPIRPILWPLAGLTRFRKPAGRDAGGARRLPTASRGHDRRSAAYRAVSVISCAFPLREVSSAALGVATVNPLDREVPHRRQRAGRGRWRKRPPKRVKVPHLPSPCLRLPLRAASGMAAVTPRGHSTQLRGQPPNQ